MIYPSDLSKGQDEELSFILPEEQYRSLTQDKPTNKRNTSYAVIFLSCTLPSDYQLFYARIGHQDENYKKTKNVYMQEKNLWQDSRPINYPCKKRPI